jgi:amino acid adenylation domain-containing protein
MIVAVLAALRAGAAYVPMDAAYPDGRLRHMAVDAACHVILTQSSLVARFDGVDCQLIAIDDVPGSAGADEEETALPVRGPDGAFYVLYTSGSTGTPKGAAVTDLGEWNLVQWYTREFGFGASDRFLVISAFGFDLTQKNFFAALTTGGTIVLPEGGGFDPDRVLDTVAASRATVVNCAPTAFYSLLDDPARFGALASIKYVVLGGEPIRVRRLEAWLRHPSCRAAIVNSYGPTECTDVVSCCRVTRPLDHPDAEVPLGMPVDRVQLHIIDDLGRPLPPYGVGELCISGVAVGLGYWHREELTAEKFVANPIGPGRMYRTGDLAYGVPGGAPVFFGRKDFQVKIRGLRIELGEIEAALAETTGIADWIVLAPGDTLIAYVKTSGEPPAISDVRARLASRLPDYMMPSGIVSVTAWPLSPNGKTDRDALARMTPPEERRAASPPQTATERRVATIWEELLERTGIGRDESFFELGGHSLLATRVAGRIRAEFGVELAIRTFFDAPTVAAIAANVEARRQPAEHDEHDLLEKLSALPADELERLLSGD